MEQEQQRQVVLGMKKLGFSEYESKAYLKLLENYPVNGYTLSKASGVPRSRIYEVLKNLMEKQMVFEHQEEKNTLYSPVEPKVFMKMVKSDYDDIFDNINRFTKKAYNKKEDTGNLVVINGRRSIFEFINHMIKGAKKRIALSIWPDDIGELLPELDKALGRGIILRGIFFGEQVPYDTLVPHRRIKRLLAHKKQRYLSVIIDGATVLSGIVSRGEDSKVTWTHDEGLIEMSEDFIAHDLVINLYSSSLEKQEYKKFEEFSEDVYHRYFHYSKDEMETFKKML